MGLLVSGTNLLKGGGTEEATRSARSKSPGLVEALLNLWEMLQSFSKNLLRQDGDGGPLLKKALLSLPPEGPAA